MRSGGICLSYIPAALIFSSRSAVASCCHSMSIRYFRTCHARPGSELRPLTQVLDCTTFVIDLRWPRCSTGTGPDRMWTT
jgi:hypothetical protein